MHDNFLTPASRAGELPTYSSRALAELANPLLLINRIILYNLFSYSPLVTDDMRERFPPSLGIFF